MKAILCCWLLMCAIIVLPALDAKNVKDKKQNENNKQNKQKQKQPTPYPASFQIDFATNLTEHDSDNETSWPIRGRLYYDWSIRKQRIDHDVGAYECVHFYNTSSSACSLIFNSVGMYRLIDDDEMPCCLDLPGVGTPPPDWAKQANGTFNGVVLDEISSLTAFQWTFDGSQPPVSSTRLSSSSSSNTSAFHTVREVALGIYSGRPLTFTFPGKANGRQDYHFDVRSMVVGPPQGENWSSSIFDIPDDCTNLSCQAAAG